MTAVEQGWQPIASAPQAGLGSLAVDPRRLWVSADPLDAPPLPTGAGQVIPPYASEEEQGVGASFTPGPWGPETTVPIRGNIVQVAFLCAADAGSDSDVTARANLALIATAPELYDALDDAVATLAAVRATASDHDAWKDAAEHFSETCLASLTLARSALIKARGDSAAPSGDRP